eukprot:1997742-Prymnesium_polylepis.1
MAGGACRDRMLGYGKSCAYPSRFATFFESCRASGKTPASNSSFYFENRAIPATSTAGVLPQLPSLLSIVGAAGRRHSPTLLIVDFSVNDVISTADEQGRLAIGDYDIFRAVDGTWPAAATVPGADAVASVPLGKVSPQEEAGFMDALRPPAPAADGRRPRSMFLNANSSSPARFRLSEGVMGMTEVMLRYILSELPETAIVLMDGSCCVSRSKGGDGKCGPQAMELYDLSRRSRAFLAAAYGLPYLSYAELLKDECTNANYFAQFAHPDARTHSIMAHGLELWWMQLVQNLGRASGSAARQEGARERAGGRTALGPPLAREWQKFDIICREALATYDPRAIAESGNPNALGA